MRPLQATQLWARMQCSRSASLLAPQPVLCSLLLATRRCMLALMPMLHEHASAALAALLSSSVSCSSVSWLCLTCVRSLSEHPGGGTTPLAVKAIFADPWPEDVLAAFMHALSRRLLSAPAAAPYLLGCAAAVASVAPSRIRQEQLHAMWDVCLR